MDIKEKAKELVERFMAYSDYHDSKQCALICVDEIISQWDYIDTYLADLNGELKPNLKYWNEVKEKIKTYE
tara:strand:+ start:41 stop:253 length:213 start_codon:yes stop_codon:yes gene_type:complete